MKKNFIIRNIIISILLIGIIAFAIYYFIKLNNKNYEITKVEQYNYFILKQNDLSGIIDRSGNKIVDAKYEEIKIPNPEKAVFICYNQDNIKVVNEKNEEILTQYDEVEPIRLKNIASDLMYEKSILKYKENGKYGLISFDGKKITNAVYDEIEGLPYKEGELLVKQNEKYGVINIKGYKLIDIIYDQVSVDGYYTYQEGYKYAGYIVSNKTEEGYRYGYINDKGKQILPLEYNELSRITDIEDNKNAYLIVAKNGQFGLTKNENEVIKNEYQSISYDKNNSTLVVEKSKKYGVLTLDGKNIVPVKYNQINIVGIYIYAKNDEETVAFNKDGTKADININIAILNTENEKYRIRINNEDGTQYGVIGKNGEQIIEEKYHYIEYLYEDFFIVSDENSKLGVIDNKNNAKIAIENDSLQKLENTDIIQTVVASKNRLTTLYAKDMSKICEMENAIVEIKDNYIKIYNDQDVKYFSKDGKELKNTDVYENNVLFAKKENDKWGFVDKNNNIIVNAKYDKVTEFNEYGFAGVQKDEKWGVIDEKGNEIITPTYSFEEDKEVYFIGSYYQVKYGFGEVYYTDEK